MSWWATSENVHTCRNPGPMNTDWTASCTENEETDSKVLSSNCMDWRCGSLAVRCTLSPCPGCLLDRPREWVTTLGSWSSQSSQRQTSPTGSFMDNFSRVSLEVPNYNHTTEWPLQFLPAETGAKGLQSRIFMSHTSWLQVTNTFLFAWIVTGR